MMEDKRRGDSRNECKRGVLATSRGWREHRILAMNVGSSPHGQEGRQVGSRSRWTEEFSLVIAPHS